MNIQKQFKFLMSGVKKLKTPHRYLDYLEFERIRKLDVRKIQEVLSDANTLLTFGTLCEELARTREFKSFIQNEQEIILSALPIKQPKENLDSINKLMESSNWRFNYPIGLLTSSIIKPETIKLHLISCSNCNCSVIEMVNGTLNSGLRQIFTSEVVESIAMDSEIYSHPVSKEIAATLAILENGLSIAIDGERYDPGNTGTNRVAVQLVEQLQKSTFTKSVTILIPASQSLDSVSLDTHILQVGLNNSILSEYDILFRPYQSWETSWLFNNWGKFQVHIQWWLDFISFEIPDYAGGYDGITKNLAQAQWAFNYYDSTLFLSPSCKEKAECLGGILFKHNDVLPCTINKSGQEFHENKEKIILVVGNSFNHKGRILAIKVFEKLLEIDPEFQLVLIGGNPGFALSNSLENEILNQNKGLKNRVHDLGKVDDVTLIEYYKKSSFLFSASTVEGFGLVPFEAASFGVVPLTSKIDAWEDYLDLDYWIDLYSIEKNVKTILDLYNSKRDQEIQISKFLAWTYENDWEYIANKCILHFAKTMYHVSVSRNEVVVSGNRFKNFLKRSRIFPFLLPIWRFLKNG